MKSIFKIFLALLIIPIAFLVFMIGKYVYKYCDYFQKYSIRKP